MLIDKESQLNYSKHLIYKKILKIRSKYLFETKLKEPLVNANKRQLRRFISIWYPARTAAGAR